MARLTLAQQAEKYGIRIPRPGTLRRYGMDAGDWLALLAAQGWRCPICERRMPTFNVDHEHVRGWANMEAAERRRYVRGILCVHCNWKMVNSNLPADKAQRIANYLQAYEERRDA